MRVRLTRERLNMRDFNVWRYSVDAWLMLGWFVGWSLLEYCWAVDWFWSFFLTIFSLFCSFADWLFDFDVNIGSSTLGIISDPNPNLAAVLAHLSSEAACYLLQCCQSSIAGRLAFCIGWIPLASLGERFLLRFLFFIFIIFHFIWCVFFDFFCIAVWCSVMQCAVRVVGEWAVGCGRVRSGESQCRGRTLRTLEADNPNPNGTWCMAHGTWPLHGRCMAGHIWNHLNVTSNIFKSSEFYAMFE